MKTRPLQVLDALLLPVAKQARQLRRGQARGPAPESASAGRAGLAQDLVAEPPQCLPDVPVERLGVGKADFRLGAPGQEPLDLFQALDRFQLELQN